MAFDILNIQRWKLEMRVNLKGALQIHQQRLSTKKEKFYQGNPNSQEKNRVYMSTK